MWGFGDEFSVSQGSTINEIQLITCDDQRQPKV